MKRGVQNQRLRNSIHLMSHDQAQLARLRTSDSYSDVQRGHLNATRQRYRYENGSKLQHNSAFSNATRSPTDSNLDLKLKEKQDEKAPQNLIYQFSSNNIEGSEKVIVRVKPTPREKTSPDTS